MYASSFDAQYELTTRQNFECFTHASLHGLPSYEFEAPEDAFIVDYERLENLGDGILKASMTAYIYTLFPRITPGGASMLRAALDCNEHLAVLSSQYGLPDRLQAIRGKAEQLRANPNVRSDIFEAYVGALFRQYGWETTHQWVCGAFDADIRATYTRLKNAVQLKETAAQNDISGQCVSLLEMWKGRDPSNRLIAYEEVGISGPSHAPSFEIICKINGEERGRGRGPKKKSAKNACVCCRSMFLDLLTCSCRAAQEAAMFIGLLGGEYMPL